MQFDLDGKLLVVSFDDLCKRKGCHELDGSNYCECKDCDYKYGCPAETDIER